MFCLKCVTFQRISFHRILFHNLQLKVALLSTATQLHFSSHHTTAMAITKPAPTTHHVIYTLPASYNTTWPPHSFPVPSSHSNTLLSRITLVDSHHPTSESCPAISHPSTIRTLLSHPIYNHSVLISSRSEQLFSQLRKKATTFLILLK